LDEQHLVTNPEDLDNAESQTIHTALDYALLNNGKIDDTIRLQFLEATNSFYSKIQYANIWSHKGKWDPLTDSLFKFIEYASLAGLYSNDYYFSFLQSLKNKLDTDPLKREDAVLWTKADLMFTDGFIHLIKDLKEGRLVRDSVSLNKIQNSDSFCVASLTTFLAAKQLFKLLINVQPKNSGYWNLKNCIPTFLDSMDKHVYTYISYPIKFNNVKDSLSFIKSLRNRLQESGCIETDSARLADTLDLRFAIKKYQNLKGIKQDGKVSVSLISLMNTNGLERFKTIALTLDRYKQLPDLMPEKYIWVNLPAYSMQVWNHDTLVMTSKIICGKPSTRTPLLNSYITDMVTYPTWTVPTSIIAKQFLPKLKRNPNYLSRLGMHLINAKGQTVTGTDVNWSKYHKGIPFKVMQGSGDGNALGIFKFNFSNIYSVYLHDTNQRYLFKNGVRDLSHGCVRVQDWQKLASFIASNDSIHSKPGNNLQYNMDSINTWIAQKTNKKIAVKSKVFLFIRYFTCEAKEGKIKFYDDIYGEDKLIKEKYFKDKILNN